MRCKPCRVTYQGTRYQINADGSVQPGRVVEEQVTDGRAMPTGETMRTRVWDAPVDADLAQAVRREAARQRRNRNARERHEAMTDLGMKRTPYGYE